MWVAAISGNSEEKGFQQSKTKEKKIKEKEILDSIPREAFNYWKI